MTLKELMTICQFGTYSVHVVDKAGEHIAFINIDTGTSPDYAGPFYSKHHREQVKENKSKMKLYADCIVEKVRCLYGGNPDIKVIKEV